MIVNDSKPVIVTISEKIEFKDSKLNFEILFLNKTTIMSPNIPYDNYLFIRNLNSEKKRIDDRSSVSCESIEKDKNNNEICTSEKNIDKSLNINIQRLYLSNNYEMMNPPQRFHDSALLSQKIPKKLRSKIFNKIVKENLTDSENYKFKFRKGTHEHEEYWTIKPNEIRPLAEITNKKSNHKNCKPQEMRFPYFNNFLSICSTMNDDPPVCHLRRDMENIEYNKYCNQRQYDFDTDSDKHDSLPYNKRHPLIDSIIENVNLIEHYCKIFNKKSENLYDNLHNSFKAYQDCLIDFSEDVVSEKRGEVENISNIKCYTEKENIYKNTNAFCSILPNIFRKFINIYSKKCKMNEQHISRRQFQERNTTTQVFFKSFQNILTAIKDSGILPISGWGLDEFRKRQNIFHKLNSNVLKMQDPSRPNDLSYKEFKNIVSQIVQHVEEAKQKYMTFNQNKIMNQTMDAYCKFVQASRSVDYIDFFKKFQFSTLKYKFIKNFARYIYYNTFETSMFGPKEEEKNISGFDIFRNKNLEYLSESLFFILLAKIRKYSYHSFKLFPLIFVKRNRRLFKKKLFEKFLRKIGKKKFIIKTKSFEMLNMCSEYCQPILTYLKDWIIGYFDRSFVCDGYKLYKIHTKKASKHKLKQYRMVFMKLMSVLFGPNDLKFCSELMKSQEESFVVQQEIYTSINSMTYEYTFPIIIRRDRLLFDHNYLDLGVISHFETYHSGDIFISNKSHVPLIIRKIFIYHSNPKATIYFVSSYRENILLPFQKERLLLCKIFVGFKEETEVEFEEVSGYLEAELLLEGFNDLVKERLFFKAKFSKNFLDFGPKNKISLQNEGKDIEIINSKLDDYKRFSIYLTNKSNNPLYIENYEMIEKKNSSHLYEFSAINYQLLNDSNNSLLKRSKENIRCNDKNGNKSL